jgi:hypothetical protein
MSKERALRRAAREAEAERERVRRSRRTQRAARRRALLLRRTPARRLTPARRTTRRRSLSRWLTRAQRRPGRLYARRGYAQRVVIALATVAVLAFVWWQFDDLATRIALTALVAVAAPAAVVLTFGRRT